MAPTIFNPEGNILQQHPAETAMPIATVLAALIAKIAGVEDTDTILYIALALSFIPAAITWAVKTVQSARNTPSNGVPQG